MLTLEETIQLILKQLPEYDRKDILTMIDEKRQELGPEVVNEESAAMIVARELGIDLQQLSPKIRLRIEDITETTRNVALIGKVASVGEPRTFARKSGEGEGQVASLIIADKTGNMRVVLWDEMTKAISEGHVTVGSIIQIRGAYAKKGLGSSLELNMGRMGTIRVLSEHELEDLEVELSDVNLTKLGDIQDKMFDIALKVKIQKVFNLSTFTRKTDGSEGKVMSVICGDETASARLVFWDNHAEEMQSVKEGEVIGITGAYTRLGRYGDIEVHAGRTSKIERNLKEKIDAVEPVIGSTVSEPLGKKAISELDIGMRDVDVEGKIAKIFPSTSFERDGRQGQVQNVVVADESGSIRVTFWNEDVDKIAELKEGDIISIKHGYVKEGFRGGVDYQVGRRAEIEINPEGSSLEQLDLSQVSLQPTIQAGRVMIGEINDETEGRSVELCGIVVGVSQTSPVYQACPSCRKKLVESDGKLVCTVCGEVSEPEPRMLYKITLDDGSGSIRITLFGKAGEDLLQMTAQEAHNLISETGNRIAPIEQNSDKMLGRYIAIQGRVNKYRDELDISASSLAFADPIEEIKRMRETINGLLG